MTYQIYPIKVGSIFYYRGGFTSNSEEYKEKEEFPILIFLLQGNGRNILVDTGGGDPLCEDMQLSGHAQTIRLPDERPDQALAKLGIKAEDIDTVILTHLHWDHCYNNHLFPQAEFFVQRKEIMAAVDPLPKFRKMYETFTTGLIPPWARQRTKWNFIDGDYSLCDGVRLLLLPGHTPGLQGVLADTENGVVLIASDAVPLYECIQGLEEGEYGISSLCVDLNAFYKTFDRLRDLQKKGVRIIASHDFKTLSPLLKKFY